jgi:hypothetical protein
MASRDVVMRAYLALRDERGVHEALQLISADEPSRARVQVALSQWSTSWLACEVQAAPTNYLQ